MGSCFKVTYGAVIITLELSADSNVSIVHKYVME